MSLEEREQIFWKFLGRKMISYKRLKNGHVIGTGILNPILDRLSILVMIFFQSNFYKNVAVGRWKGRLVSNTFAPPIGSGPMLRALKGLIKNFLMGFSMPIALTFAVTYRCQCKCVHCSAADHIRKDIKELTTKESKKLIDDAQKLGRPVHLKNLDDMKLEQSGRFDVACSFQVLEHVSDPAGFLGGCVKLLKPGGRLLISVPNSIGFIRLADNDLLNTPPHHVTRWSKFVFESLPRYFSLELQKILYEPLAPYHISWYANLQLSRLPHVPYLTKVIHFFVLKLVLPLAGRTRFNRFLRGHTIYVHYQKR